MDMDNGVVWGPGQRRGGAVREDVEVGGRDVGCATWEGVMCLTSSCALIGQTDRMVTSIGHQICSLNWVCSQGRMRC